jgi:ribose transport system permease protein
VAGLSGVMGTMAMSSWGMPIVAGILVGVLVGAIAGAANGLLITQMKLPPFIATLGMMGVARGLTFIVSGSVAIYGLSGAFRNVGEGQIGPIPLPLLYLIVIAVLGHLTLSRTRLGRYSYAIGSNPDAARLSGISTTRVLIGVYVICAALAGFGGMIAASRVHSGQPNYGIGLELDVIAACVIGGASLFGGQGTIGGTIIGALLMGVIRNGAVLLNITQYYQMVVIGVIIWLAVWWDQLRRTRMAAASERAGGRDDDEQAESSNGSDRDRDRDRGAEREQLRS